MIIIRVRRSASVFLSSFLILSFLTISYSTYGAEIHVPADYPTIQAAIDAAADYDTVIVAPNTYYENIYIIGKSIALTSTDPNSPAIIATTIIDGNDTGSVVTFVGSGTTGCQLTGFTITGGYTTEFGGGICGRGTLAAISNCIIRDNTCENAGGGIHRVNGMISHCTFTGNTAFSGGGLGGCQGTISNCLISGNNAEKGAGLNGCGGKIINCTITSNTAGIEGVLKGCSGSFTNCIIWANSPDTFTEHTATMAYCCWPDGSSGLGNIDNDPDLAFSTDYYLMLNSPCIDAGTNTPTGGLPTTDIEQNPRIMDGDNDSNSVVDIGAYEFDAGRPLIALSAKSLQFTAHHGLPEPNEQIISIRNSGVGTLQWQISHDCNWLHIIPAAGTNTGEIDNLTFSVNQASVDAGSYTCIVTVTDTQAANNVQIIVITLHVGTSLHVPVPYNTIQAAIDEAVDGDIVLVADGTHSGTGNRDIDFNGKAITVKSQNGPEGCIIDCRKAGRAFHFQSGEGNDSVINGFTIIEGWAVSGGGIYCENSSPTIINCNIRDNYARRYGGGISNENSNAIIRRCTFNSNRTTERNGGGINNTESNPIIIDCVFTGNRAAWDGGGINNEDDSSPIISNCDFTNNSAVGNDGGGINNRDSTPLISNCSFIGNSANDWGGAMRNISSSSPIISGCIFIGNSSNSGAGVYNYRYSNPTFMNCRFKGNIARQNGGGIGNRLSCNPLINNCIITGNTARIDGGGMSNRSFGEWGGVFLV